MSERLHLRFQALDDLWFYEAHRTVLVPNGSFGALSRFNRMVWNEAYRIEGDGCRRHADFCSSMPEERKITFRDAGVTMRRRDWLPAPGQRVRHRTTRQQGTVRQVIVTESEIEVRVQYDDGRISDGPYATHFVVEAHEPAFVMIEHHA